LRATFFGIVLIVAVLLLGLTILAEYVWRSGWTPVSPPG
jgi:hypothetical protein